MNFDNAAKILRTLLEKDGLTRDDIQKITGINVNDVNMELCNMKEKQVLQKTRSTKKGITNTCYYIIEDLNSTSKVKSCK